AAGAALRGVLGVVPGAVSGRCPVQPSDGPRRVPGAALERRPVQPSGGASASARRGARRCLRAVLDAGFGRYWVQLSSGVFGAAAGPVFAAVHWVVLGAAPGEGSARCGLRVVRGAVLERLRALAVMP